MGVLGFRSAILVATTLVGSSGCEPVTTQTEQAQSADFPIRRTIRDDRGRSIEVDIVARGSSELTFIRRSDQKKFTIPISRLSSRDERFVESLPMHADTTTHPRPDEPRPNPRIASRLREIERIELRIEEAERERNAYEPETLKAEAITREIEELRSEKEELETEISNIRSAER